MLFNSIEFALFLPIVFLLYWFVFSRNGKWQNAMLVLASVFFYCFADAKFFLLLVASAGFNYCFAWMIHKKPDGNAKRWLFYVGIAFNVGLLLYFKYFNWFIDGFVKLCNVFGGNVSFTPFHILLPLGISFFTFQLIGYLIDVYNEEIEPSGNLLAFTTYVTYFPKMLSGPIERIQNFLPQIEHKREFDYGLAVDGMRQILWGLFKKVVVANNLAPIVDNIFNDYSNMSGSTLLMGAMFYLLQLYADFSGYSDMACGISKLFNIKIINNFHFPFFSTNISDFWKKWHISLTTWMMDYVFTPLSFILRDYKKWGLILSIFITFILIGLWHGGGSGFIVFGLLQGAYFIPLILRNRMNKSSNMAVGRLLPSFKQFVMMVGLFLLMSMTMIFGRAESASIGFEYISEMFSWSLIEFPDITNKGMLGLGFILLMLITEWLQRTKEHGLDLSSVKNSFARFCIYFLIIFVCYIFKGDVQQFIYFQF